MQKSERDIIFTNDLDGVHFKAPPLLRTSVTLFRKEFSLPEERRPIGEYLPPDGWRGEIYSKWSILFHQVRPMNKEALEGLALFQQAAEAHERKLRFAALSGREKDKHAMTRKRLEKAGHMEYFNDLYLNEGVSSSAWKESVVRNLTESGLNVVHIDDDIRAGLRIARVNTEYPEEERVLVYIMRNISNHPYLLNRAGIKVPKNLLFVPTFKAAAIDFNERLNKGML